MRNELNAIIVEKFREGYKNAGKKEKSKILDDLERLTGLDRKHLIKLLRRKRPVHQIKTVGRPRNYSEEVSKHILELHILMDQISPKRMKEAIFLWLPSYEKHYGLLHNEVKEKLLKISSSTIGRIIKENKQKIRGKSSTRVVEKIKSIIPIKRLDEKVTSPGTIQADTVAHCGASLSGEFVYTLTMTDIYSNWTENRACWTKGSMEIKRSIENVEKSMPIVMKHFDTDCGTEFLNYRIMRHFQKGHHRRKAVQMRRGRPYKKNDQCYVEQKNNTHVRNIFGYDRIDDPKLVDVMNEIYKRYWNPLNNFFLPSFKLVEKHRYGGKIKKRFDKPKTPAQRLLDHKGESTYMKRVINEQLKRLDPIQLKKDLDMALKNFYILLDKQGRYTA